MYEGILTPGGEVSAIDAMSNDDASTAPETYRYIYVGEGSVSDSKGN